ncbi:MAG: hypothetical protein H7259_09560 [Cytophagales bacterium]|nr:hypothetical protein [Cytophaga sp.]
MFKYIGRLVLISISFLLSITTYSQGLGNSPYSRLGIGDVENYKGTVRNMGMGYAGSAVTNKYYMNILNPAGLANFKNRKKNTSLHLKNRFVDSLVKIDVGYTVQYKTFKIGDKNSSSWGANINYLAFMFPVSKVFATSLILTPLTSVQNNYSFVDSIKGDPNHYNAQYTYKGSGGIYQLQWANGLGLTENLSVGLTTNFNFGSISQEATTQIVSDSLNSSLQNQVGTNKKTSYSGVSFKPGFIYNKELNKRVRHIDTIFSNSTGLRDSITRTFTIKPRGISWSAGGTIEFEGPIKSTETQTLFIRNAKNQNVTDSTLTKSRAPAYFPTIFRAGFALEKSEYWTIALDLAYSDWSNFDKNKFKSDSLAVSSYSAFLGGEYLAFNKEKPYRSRTYRAGFAYSATPVMIAGNRVNDYSFSIGAAIPVGVRVKGSSSNGNNRLPLPKVNIAFVVGQRSSAGIDQLSEMYYRLHLSMVIYDKWFAKKKIQ